MATLEDVRKKGRFGDTILAHISPDEAAFLKLTGGSGTINPETGLLEFFGFGDLFGGSGGGLLGSILTGGLSDAYAGYQKYADGGSFYDAIDRAIDPGGTVDASIRGLGNTGLGETLSPVVDIVGPLAGGVVGGIYGGPWGAAGGAAAGEGFASKWKGKSNEDAMKSSALAAVLAGGGSYLGGLATGGTSGGELAGLQASTMDIAPAIGADISGAGGVGAGLDAGSAAYPALAGDVASSGGYNYDLADAIKALQSGDQVAAEAAMNRAAEMGPAIAGGAMAGYGASEAATPAGPGASVTDAAADAAAGYGPGATSTGDAVGAPLGSLAPEKTGMLSNLFSGVKKAYPYAMLAGTVLNAAGNYMGAGQTNDNLEAYRGAAAWTPERVAALTKGVDTSVLGIYGKNAADSSKTIAGNLASSGRGGGSSESARRSLDIATKNAAATAKNNALLQAGVYTPPGQITGGGAYGEVNPYASTLTGASATLGNYSNAMMTSEMLKKLYPALAGGV